jgi:hypothetical protein
VNVYTGWSANPEACVVLILAQVHVVAVVPAAGFLVAVQGQSPRRPQQEVAVVFVAQLRQEHLPGAVVRLSTAMRRLCCNGSDCKTETGSRRN